MGRTAAVVKAYFRGDASKYLLADPDAPIFTLNLTQNAGSGAIDVKTVYYDLSPIGGNVIAQLKVTQSAEGAAAVSVVR